MAKILIAKQLIEDRIFGFSANPVRITDMSFDTHRQALVVDIEGADVPDAPEVSGLCHVQQNRAGQSFITMTFEGRK